MGFQTAKALVKRDATVILACRDLTKANEAIAKIRLETSEGKMIPLELDLASFESIRNFAKKIQEDFPVFTCLINNAGLAVQDEQYTKDNFELHFGVNHLGPFLLTNLLKNEIEKNQARIVVVASKMHERGKIDFENLGKFVPKEPRQRTNALYNNSKLVNFYFAKELYKKGHDVHVLCPGLCNTDFFRSFNPKFYHYILLSPIVLWYLRSPEQGAQNIIHCATEGQNSDEKNPSKSYIVIDLKQTKSKIELSDEISEKLWNESVKLCGL